MAQNFGYYAFESAFSVNNFVAGFSLIVLSLTLQFVRTGVIREEYERAIGALFGAIGLQFLCLAFNAATVIQIAVSSVMTILALSVSSVILYDAVHEAWSNIKEKFKRG